MPARPLLAAATAIAITAAACGFWRKPPPERPPLANAALTRKLDRLLRYDVPLVSVDSLAAHPHRARVLLLDAREPEEYTVSHLAGAIQVDPRGKLPPWTDTVDRERQVTVYCSVGYRSENVARRLREAGFTKVSNLYGSIFEWVDRGYPLVDSTGRPTRRVHTYNERWGELVTHPEAQKTW